MKKIVLIIYYSTFYFTNLFSQNPVLLNDINPGTPYSGVTSFFKFNNKVLFTATSQAAGNELWISDGTPAGTFMLKDINPGTASGGGGGFIIFNNLVFFYANDGVHGGELWKTDGTTGGTVMVKDIEPGSGNGPAGNLFIFNNQLFFIAHTTSNGLEFWKTDGTTAGTVMVKDIYPGSGNGVGGWGGTYYGKAMVLNGNFYFIGTDAGTNYELWKSDGTAAGTVLVKDVNPGANSCFQSNMSYNNFFIFNNELYFRANDGTHGYELWKSNGTIAGTFMIKDTYIGTNNGIPSAPVYCIFNNILIFQGNYSANDGGLWRTDGTTAGTYLIKDSTNLEDYIVYNNILLFDGYDPSHGEELWKTDGTVAGTVMVKEINPGLSGDVIYAFYSYNGMVLFSADDGTHGAELWRTDGTTAGTYMVKDIYVGSAAASSFPGFYGTLRNKVIMQAVNNIYGQELWQTDGTSAGTQLLKDIESGTSSSLSANEFIKVPPYIFFEASASPPVFNNELWITDGTAAGTVLTKDIRIGSNGSDPRDYFFTSTHLFFTADDSIHGRESWAYKYSNITSPYPTPLKIINTETTNEPLDQINIYPTFSEGTYTVEIKTGFEKELSYYIFDCKGREIQSQKIITESLSSFTLDISKYSKGIYFLKIISGSLIKTCKLIRQ